MIIYYILRWRLILLLIVISTRAFAQLPPVFKKGLFPDVQQDNRTVAYMNPARIVWMSDTTRESIINTDALLEKGKGQAILFNNNACIMKTNDTLASAILLDFGKEIYGGLQIVTGMTLSKEPIKLRVRFGESVSEAMSEIGGERNATNEHSIRDFIISVPWLGTVEIGNSGFRFARIDVVDKNAEVQLKEVRAKFIYRDIPYLGSFKSNDERLNKIWITGAYTIHLCMQDYLWDGIKRDRLVWIGDMHPEVMAINSVFGYNEVVPLSLDLIRNATPDDQWMNGIGSYSMWWLLIQYNWYKYQGNFNYLNEQKGYSLKLLNKFLDKINNENSEIIDGWRFLDWPTSENELAIHAGTQALLILTIQAGAELCKIWKEVEMYEKCRDAVERLRKHVPDPANSKQSVALMTLAGLIPAEKANTEILAVDGPKRISTFYGYYVLQARAMAGDYQGAIDCIRQYWGAMLDLGATTFWEDFNMEWLPNAAHIDEIVPKGKKDIHGDYGDYCYKGFRHSLCHGWASGPTSWLTEHVLGIKVMEPACKVIKIEPHLADLEWVEGTFPTPSGILSVKHVKSADGKITTTIDAPKNIKVINTSK